MCAAQGKLTIEEQVTTAQSFFQFQKGRAPSLVLVDTKAMGTAVPEFVKEIYDTV